MAPVPGQISVDVGGQSLKNTNSSRIELESPETIFTNKTAQQYVELQLGSHNLTITNPANQVTVQHLSTYDAVLNESFVANQTDTNSTLSLYGRDANGKLMLLFALLVLINLIVILGNILVIVAVYANAKLRSVTNIFIVSLATADLLLGVLVLPYAMLYEVLDVWIFGQIWCRGWLVTDVWISTASILNLCAISIDRYVAVTRPVKYRSIMTARRAKCIVAIVWILSFIICFPPLLPNWSAPTFPSIGSMGTPFQSDRRPLSEQIVSEPTATKDNDDSIQMMAQLELNRTKRQLQAESASTSSDNYYLHFDRTGQLWDEDNDDDLGTEPSISMSSQQAKEQRNKEVKPSATSPATEIDDHEGGKEMSNNSDNIASKNNHNLDNNISSQSQNEEETRRNKDNWRECRFQCTETFLLAERNGANQDNKQFPNRGFIIIIEQRKKLKEKKFNDCGALELSLLLPPFGYICNYKKNKLRSKRSDGTKQPVKFEIDAMFQPSLEAFGIVGFIPLGTTTATAATTSELPQPPANTRADCDVESHSSSLGLAVVVGYCELAAVAAVSTGSGSNAMKSGENGNARVRLISLVDGVDDNDDVEAARGPRRLLVSLQSSNAIGEGSSNLVADEEGVVRNESLISVADGKWAGPFKLVAKPKSNSIVFAKYCEAIRRWRQIISNASSSESGGRRKGKPTTTNQNNSAAIETSGQRRLGRDDLPASASQSNMKSSTGSGNGSSRGGSGSNELNPIRGNRKPKISLRTNADHHDQPKLEPGLRNGLGQQQRSRQRPVFNVANHSRISIELLSGCYGGGEQRETEDCVRFKMCLLSDADADGDDDVGAPECQESSIFLYDQRELEQQQPRPMPPISIVLSPKCSLHLDLSLILSFDDSDGFHANENNVKNFIGKRASEYICLNDFTTLPPTGAQRFTRITFLTRLELVRGNINSKNNNNNSHGAKENGKKSQILLQKMSLKCVTKDSIRCTCVSDELVKDFSWPNGNQSARFIVCPFNSTNNRRNCSLEVFVKLNADDEDYPAAQATRKPRASSETTKATKGSEKSNVKMDEFGMSFGSPGRRRSQSKNVIESRARGRSAKGDQAKALIGRVFSLNFMLLASGVDRSAKEASKNSAVRGHLVWSHCATSAEAPHQNKEHLVANSIISYDVHGGGDDDHDDENQKPKQSNGIKNFIGQHGQRRRQRRRSESSQTKVVCSPGELRGLFLLSLLQELNEDCSNVCPLVVVFGPSWRVNNVRRVNSQEKARESANEVENNNNATGVREQRGRAGEDKQPTFGIEMERARQKRSASDGLGPVMTKVVEIPKHDRGGESYSKYDKRHEAAKVSPDERTSELTTNADGVEPSVKFLFDASDKQENGRNRYGPPSLTCTLFHEKTYVIYSALGSFYIPMLVMVFFYSRIYLVASRAHKAMQRGYMTTKSWPATFDDGQSGANSSDQNCRSAAKTGMGREGYHDDSYSCAKGIKSRGPERVTLRIHRRTNQHQQQSKESLSQQHSLTDTQSPLATLADTNLRLSNSDLKLRPLDSVDSSQSKSMENQLGCKSILLQLTAIEQRQSSASARTRRTRFSFDNNSTPTHSPRTPNATATSATTTSASVTPASALTSTTDANFEASDPKRSDSNKGTGLQRNLDKLLEQNNTNNDGSASTRAGYSLPGTEKIHMISQQQSNNIEHKAPSDNLKTETGTDCSLHEKQDADQFNDCSISNSNRHLPHDTKEHHKDHHHDQCPDNRHQQNHQDIKRYHDDDDNHHHHHRHHHSHRHHHRHHHHHREHKKLHRHHHRHHHHCHHHHNHNHDSPRHGPDRTGNEVKDHSSTHDYNIALLKDEINSSRPSDFAAIKTKAGKDPNLVQITISKYSSPEGGCCDDQGQEITESMKDDEKDTAINGRDDGRTRSEQNQANIDIVSSSATTTNGPFGADLRTKIPVHDEPTPRILVNWDPGSELVESQLVVNHLTNENNVNSDDQVAGPRAEINCDNDGGSAGTAAGTNQSGSGLSLMANLAANQVRKQSMMLLTSLTTRSSQTLRRLSMAAAYPVDALLRVRSRSRQSDFDRDDDDDDGHGGGYCEAETTSSVGSSCELSKLSGSKSDVNNIQAQRTPSQGRRVVKKKKKLDKKRHKGKSKSKKKGYRSVSPLTGQKKTLDDYLMAVAGIDTSSDDNSREYCTDDYDDTMSDGDDDDDDGVNGDPTFSASSSSDESLNLSKMLTRENLLIPKIAITNKCLESVDQARGNTDKTSGGDQDSTFVKFDSIDENTPYLERSMSVVGESLNRSLSTKDLNSNKTLSNLREQSNEGESSHPPGRREQQLQPSRQAAAGRDNADSASSLLSRAEDKVVGTSGSKDKTLETTRSAAKLKLSMEPKLLNNSPRSSAAGLHRQGALYESATSRASIEINSANGGQMATATSASGVSIASVAVAKLVDLAAGHRTSHQLVKSKETGNNGLLSPRPAPTTNPPVSSPTPTRRRGAKRTSRWHAKRLRAETKAAKTVAIIVGGFIFCWLPFFTAYLTRAIVCNTPQCIPQSLLSLFIWLGYLNSAINPVIYGLFSADFRHAFKNIVCRCRLRNNHDDTATVSVLVDSIIKSIM